ncbi:MAG: zinc-ribbon domain-containing protein [Desulfovibrionaceae bacterium]|nr:zinc-ribbon domain-containing protein [Desulfovibrionaceae bacterium]
MKISCPECHFESDVHEDALPKRTAIATCPKCKCKFRFSPTAGVLGVVEPKNDAEADSGQPLTSELDSAEPNVRQNMPDDPLPDGAIIIGPTATRNDKTRLDEESSRAGEKSEANQTRGPEKKSLLADLFDKKKSAEPRNVESSSASKKQVGQKQPLETAQDSVTAETRVKLKTVGTRRTSNPWDRAPGRIGYIGSFYQTCLRVMLVPPRFFASLSAKQSYHPALIFYIIICVIEFLLNFAWMSVLRHMVAGANDQDLVALLALLAPQGNVFLRLLLQTALAAVKLYLVAGLFYGILQVIAPKNNNFTLIYQVVAYSAAPSLLCIVPIAGTLAGMFWGIACLAIGLRAALKITWPQTVIAFLPLIVFFATFAHFLGAIPM